jgi:hypothetical protein
MHRDSIFRKAIERKEQRLYIGFKYRDKIIEKTVSPYLLGISSFMDKFLLKLDAMVFNNIEAVKKIKIFANPALDKNETKIN